MCILLQLNGKIKQTHFSMDFVKGNSFKKSHLKFKHKIKKNKKHQKNFSLFYFQHEFK